MAYSSAPGSKLSIEKADRSEVSDQSTARMDSYRSSRELSVRADESEQKAKQADEEASRLKAQIAALQAELEAQQESFAKHAEESKAERQAARDSLFDETMLEKQRQFRDSISNETWLRVARILKADEDKAWIECIARREDGTDDPPMFKSMILDAVAGEDQDFLPNAARLVVDQLDKVVSDEDVKSIQSSFGCLKTAQGCATEQADAHQTLALHHHDVPLGVPPNSQEPLPTSAVSQLGQDVTYFETPLDFSLNSLDIKKIIDSEKIVGIVGEGMEVAGDSELSQNDTSNLKRGPLDTSPLEDEQPRSYGTQATPTPINRKRASGGWSKAPKSLVGSARATKRAKTSSNASAETPRVKAFINHIADLTVNGTVSDSDFQCAKCNQEIKQDARITACSHLYDVKCVQDLRQLAGTTGNASIDIRCSRHGCYQSMGRPVVIEFEAVQKVKEKYLVPKGGPGWNREEGASSGYIREVKDKAQDESGDETTSEDEA